MDRCPAIVAIGFALIFLQTLSCHAAATGNGAGNTATQDESSSSEYLLPCSKLGNIILHEDSLRINECTVCDCYNATVTCNIQSCPIITCSDYQEPVTKEGDCCESCPDSSTVVDVISTKKGDGCIINGKRFLVGGVDVVDDCVTCVCQANTEMRCEDGFHDCPSIGCHVRHEIKFEGECCRACPYDIPVWRVQPSQPPAITAGQLNDVVFDLAIDITSRGLGYGVAGDDLFKVSAWAADGSGNRVGFVDQILTHEQASGDIHYSWRLGRGYKHLINGLHFALDGSDATCSQMEYLCVEMAKGDNPKLIKPIPFTLEGVASELNITQASSNLVGCIPFPTCQEPVVDNTESASGSESSSALLPCTFRGNSILHGGSMVVDDCIICSCYNSTVTCSVQQCPLIACSDGQIPVTRSGDCCDSCPDPSTEVDVVSPKSYEGCRYGDKRFPIGGIHVIDECSTCECQATHDMKCAFRSCPAAILCDNPVTLEGECCAVCPYYLPVWKVQPSEPPAITASELNDIELNLVININELTGNGPAGDDLIKVSAWAEGGSGNRVGYIDQVLTDEQASRDILRSDFYGGFEYTIDGVEFTLDASDATCSQMESLCVAISKGDNPTLNNPRIPYTVEGVASEENGTRVSSHLVGCIPFPSCQDAGTRKQVSFSVAKKSGQIAPAPVAILGWSDVFNNVGGAFDSETGVFTSSVTGSHFFTYQITKIPNMQTPQVRLMKNDEETQTGSSNSIIVNLEAGDTVWLQLQGELIGSPERYSTFTGFLI